jgi:hypothetical protein
MREAVVFDEVLDPCQAPIVCEPGCSRMLEEKQFLLWGGRDLSLVSPVLGEFRGRISREGI